MKMPSSIGWADVQIQSLNVKGVRLFLTVGVYNWRCTAYLFFVFRQFPFLLLIPSSSSVPFVLIYICAPCRHHIPMQSQKWSYTKCSHKSQVHRLLKRLPQLWTKATSVEAAQTSTTRAYPVNLRAAIITSHHLLTYPTFWIHHRMHPIMTSLLQS